ncbi:immunoglobulin lambda-1 light chain-like [Cottoperca gobio]|uniref:immunoglobulin lambda-1 light chain-like n=1 Tax=Cottoperca gobio TaxID=56716 RepID=UPI00110DCB07|nr:immunoglobulin lambda-1 light chain-like [Cottoperca gobio]
MILVAARVQSVSRCRDRQEDNDIMIRNINRITLLLLWLSCCSLSTKVHQSPSSILGNPNVSATISCNHSVSSYNVILWYQQPTGDSGLHLIGYLLYNNPTLEDPFRQHFNVTGDGSVKSQLHVLKLRQPEDSGVYYCAASGQGANYEAYFGQGTKVTVLEDGLTITPPTVQVLRPSSKECGNDDAPKKTIVCVASGFYPDHVSVSWQVDGEAVTTGVATDNAALREDDFYKITSRLRVSTKNWFNPETVFTCTVSFYNGTHTETYSDSLHGEEGGGMTREKYLRSTQTAKLSYGVLIIKSSIYGACVAFLVWKLQRSAGKQNH